MVRGAGSGKRSKPLAEYRAKRRFDVTPEPAGDKRPTRSRSARALRPLRFVVHKHRARALHYDLRLEWKGVLLSWAVPKGPSLDPTVKRLAMRTEDHPHDYDAFEGVIPAGEYGGGTMMIWDRGVWLPEDPDVDRSLERGELKFALAGEKLNGSFVLVRTRSRGGAGGDGRSWLLIKHDDVAASPEDIAETRPRSVVSGRLLAEIAFEEGGDPVGAASGDPESAVRDLLRRLSGGGRPAAPASPSTQTKGKSKSSRTAAAETKKTARTARSRPVAPPARAVPRSPRTPRSRSVPASRGRG